MSNEKQKIEMDPKYLIKLTVTLFITCVVVAGALGFVNRLTAPNIAAANLAKTQAAMQAVVADPSSDFSEALEITAEMNEAAAANGATLAEAYEVLVGGEHAGYTLKVVASGSQGAIEMMVGVDAEAACTGVSVVKHAETKGIGTKVVVDNAVVKSTGVPVLDQFQGKGQGDLPLTVGQNIDAIGGATVSTKGVTTGVNAALAVAAVMG